MKLCLSDGGANIDLMRMPYRTEGLSLAVMGNKGSGKSWTLAVLAEEAYRNQIPFIYYDVNGDAASLRELGDDVVVIGRDAVDPLRQGHYRIGEAEDAPEQYIRLAVEDGFSLVFDLSGRRVDDKARLFHRFAQAHFRVAEDVREPVMMLVDEAHQFAPQRKARGNQLASLATLIDVMSDGRKRGILLALATQRAAYLNKDVLFGMNVRMFGKITWHPDYEAIKPYLPPGTSFDVLRNLETGRYYLVSPNAYGQIVIKARLSRDLGGTPVMRVRSARMRPSVSQLRLFGVDDSRDGVKVMKLG